MGTVAIALVGLCACADMSGPTAIAGEDGTQGWADERRRQAHAHESQGDLQGALQQWRIVHAISPNSLEVNESIHRLETTIAARSQAHTHAARASMSKQAFLATKTHSLKALALEPRNDAAMILLRRLRARVALAELSESPVHEATVHAAAAPGGGSAVLGYENREQTPEIAAVGGGYTHHLELASQLDASGELEGALDHYLEARNALAQPDSGLENRIVATKTALATQYYDQGVRLFRKNLAASIAAFETALEYDPEHTKAQLYLASARRLAAGTQ